MKKEKKFECKECKNLTPKMILFECDECIKKTGIPLSEDAIEKIREIIRIDKANQ